MALVDQFYQAVEGDKGPKITLRKMIENYLSGRPILENDTDDAEQLRVLGIEGGHVETEEDRVRRAQEAQGEQDDQRGY